MLCRVVLLGEWFCFGYSFFYCHVRSENDSVVLCIGVLFLTCDGVYLKCCYFLLFFQTRDAPWNVVRE